MGCGNSFPQAADYLTPQPNKGEGFLLGDIAVASLPEGLVVRYERLPVIFAPTFDVGERLRATHQPGEGYVEFPPLVGVPRNNSVWAYDPTRAPPPTPSPPPTTVTDAAGTTLFTIKIPPPLHFGKCSYVYDPAGKMIGAMRTAQKSLAEGIPYIESVPGSTDRAVPNGGGKSYCIYSTRPRFEAQEPGFQADGIPMYPWAKLTHKVWLGIAGGVPKAGIKTDPYESLELVMSERKALIYLANASGSFADEPTFVHHRRFAMDPPLPARFTIATPAQAQTQPPSGVALGAKSSTSPPGHEVTVASGMDVGLVVCCSLATHLIDDEFRMGCASVPGQQELVLQSGGRYVGA